MLEFVVPLFGFGILISYFHGKYTNKEDKEMPHPYRSPCQPLEKKRTINEFFQYLNNLPIDAWELNNTFATHGKVSVRYMTHEVCICGEPIEMNRKLSRKLEKEYHNGQEKRQEKLLEIIYKDLNI